MPRHSHLVLTVAALSLAVAGCKKPAPVSQAELTTAPAPAEAPAADASAKPDAARLPVPVPMLAYDYAYALRLPGAAVRPLMSLHEQACISAGPATCQVIAADLTSGRDNAEGTLKLRATESWLGAFRSGLDGQIKAVGGQIQSSNIRTEDLTRQVVDTGAAIRAKAALRDRLERLMSEHPGKLKDAVELEQNIASVQGEIDAASSEQSVMQERVAMSSLTIDYAPVEAAISARSLQPLSQAAHGFAGNALAVTATLVTLTSYLLPFALIAGLAWLGWRRFGRRSRSPAAQN
jgi:hypothetical protein